MSTTWKLYDAKAQFSRLVQNALEDGPQFVTRRGKEAVVVLSTAEYQQLTADKPSFVDFLLSAPKIDDVTLERTKEPPREIDL